MSTKTTTSLNEYTLEGEKLLILTAPNEILRKKSTEVTTFNDELHTLVKNMIYTMYISNGIGLAAPQIGQNIRLIVCGLDHNNKKPLVIINPKLTNKRGIKVSEEGCLSIPNVSKPVMRSNKIIVTYQDLDGNHKTLHADGLLAICIQHEIDHLDGVLFTDKTL